MSAAKVAGEARRRLQGIVRNELFHTDTQGIEGIRSVCAGFQPVLFSLGQLLTSLILLVVVDGGSGNRQ